MDTGPVRHPFLDFPGPLAFAHRGGADDGPENTLRAFSDAVALGFHYLETDVRVTSDGVLLAFHDDVLDRVTDRHGRIETLTWPEVRRARVGGTESILRFEELLEAFPDVRINVDPKQDAALEPLMRALNSPGVLDRICVGSFSDRRLQRLRARFGAAVCTSLGPGDVARLRLASLGLPIPHLPGYCVQVPVRWRVQIVTTRFITAAEQRCLPVHVWTVDEPSRMHALLDLGVDGLMTDKPKVLKAVLQRRGQWV